MTNLKIEKGFISGGEKFSSTLTVEEGYEEHNRGELHLRVVTQTVDPHCGGCKHHWSASLDLPPVEVAKLQKFLIDWLALSQ